MKPGWRKRYAERAAEYAAHDPVRVDFLVYGECSCGWYCACPEGASWPECPKCGADILPLRNVPNERNAQPQGMGYVAELRPEVEALTIRHDRVWPDDDAAADLVRQRAAYPPGPLFDAKEVRRNVDLRPREQTLPCGRDLRSRPSSRPSP